MASTANAREHKNIFLFTPGRFFSCIGYSTAKKKQRTRNNTKTNRMVGLEKKPNLMLNIANGHETNDPKS